MDDLFKFFFPAVVVLFLFSGCSRETVISGPQEGIVKDYRHLDGCNFIIEMITGEKLEPAEMSDTSFHFYNGQRVKVWYTLLENVNSICMAGQPARIDSIVEAGCDALTEWSSSLPADPFSPDTVYIQGDCLEISVAYGGGCRNHDFFLSLLPAMGPFPVLTLAHDAHGDICEAWITDALSFDITSLRTPGSHETTFILVLNYDEATYSQEIIYHY